MAIISCPSCNESISSKAKNCTSCNFDLINNKSSAGLTDEQIASKNKLARIKRKYSLQMQATGSLVIFLLGVLLWYIGGREVNNIVDTMKVGMIAVGSLWYLITRVRLISFKRQ
ncbi:MAG: putative membrane protein [Polaribacter sp.]|jgi:uncharacterized membrane protein